MRMLRVEAGHHDLADLPFRHRIARSRRDDLDDQVLVDHHAGPRGGLVGDDAELGDGVGLVSVDAALLHPGLQRGREGRAGDQRLLDGRDGPSGRIPRLDQDLEEIRRAAIGGGL